MKRPNVIFLISTLRGRQERHRGARKSHTGRALPRIRYSCQAIQTRKPVVLKIWLAELGGGFCFGGLTAATHCPGDAGAEFILKRE